MWLKIIPTSGMNFSSSRLAVLYLIDKLETITSKILLDCCCYLHAYNLLVSAAVLAGCFVNVYKAATKFSVVEITCNQSYYNIIYNNNNIIIIIMLLILIILVIKIQSSPDISNSHREMKICST